MSFLKICAFLSPILFGYVVGSINLSIIVTKYIGKFDIHKVGSGNAGGTNVVRTMGAKYGVPVIILEIMKCFLVAAFARFVFPVDPLSLGTIGPLSSAYFAGLGCLLGNIFPLFHGFTGGGKGVTVGAAALLAADWRAFLIIFGAFLIIFLISRMVSLGSVSCAVLIPVVLFVFYYNTDFWYIPVGVALVISLIAIFRHRQNIVRIIKGKENKFSFSKKK